MAGLYEVKQWLKGLLWYVGVAIIIAAFFAWNGYSQIRGGGERHFFLLAITTAGSLILLWVLVLLFFFSARRLLDPQSFISRVSKHSFRAAWGLLTVLLVGVIVYAICLYSDIDNDAFAQLRSGKLNRLISQIEAQPALLHKGKVKNRNTLLSTAYELGNTRAVGILLAKGAQFDSLKWAKQTPLVDSVENPVMLKTLLDAGLNPNQSGGDGLLPLHYAASLGLLESVQLLVERGADVQVVDRSGRTALMHSLAVDGLPVCKYLLDIGADVNVQDSRGDTVLHKAVRRRNVDAVCLLLDNKVDAKIFNYAGFSSMHVAAINGHNELLEIFASYPELMCLCNREGDAPFDYALRGLKHRTALMLLRNCGVDINRIKPNGQTALHTVVEANSESSARFLLEHGANARIPNADGMTAYELMKRKRFENLLKMVDSHKSRPQTVAIAGDNSLFP